jgi:putative glutamine amidotransferase
MGEVTVRPRIAIPHPHSQKPEYNQRALPQYLCAIEISGGEPVPIDLALSNSDITKIAMTCDGVLLPGSPADVDPEKYGAVRDPQTAVADPQRDNADELLLQDAYNMHKPVLGICYGVQTLNVWRTGTLLQHVDNHSQGRSVKRAHMVQLEPDSLLAHILSPVWESEEGWVNSSHHQAIENVGDGLRVVARSDDGVIEAVESTSPDQFVLGIQWHPERTFDEEPSSRALFERFLEAARQRHLQPRTPVPDFESVRR